jgi:hypothetical protein
MSPAQDVALLTQAEYRAPWSAVHGDKGRLWHVIIDELLPTPLFRDSLTAEDFTVHYAQDRVMSKIKKFNTTDNKH